MRTVLALFVVIGLVAGGAVYYTKQMAADPPPSFRTATVKRDDLLSTISATGTVEPEEVVDVGAQVVRRIKDLRVDPSELKGRKAADIDPKELAKMKRVDYGTTVHPGTALAYVDPQELKKMRRVDYRSIVHEGTELAYIDPAIYNAQLAQAEATLQRAKADLIQLQAKRDQAKAEWDRARRLRPDREPEKKAASENKASLDYRAMSDSDYDLARANWEVAEANVTVGEKTIKQAEAAREMAKTNLDYTTIVSPVEGVIIDRRVNIGQTVVASLNAPSLFLIAKDLTKMQVWASVNEADIGRIHKDMPVRFTVDAFPGEVFRGKVAQIRLNATMTQNVVTYTVVVAFDNPDSKVLPYLTANVQFEVEQRRNVLLVPNAALRWKPRPQLVAPDAREAVSPAWPGKGGGQEKPPSAKSPGESGAQPAKPAKPTKEREDRGRLWVQDGDFVRPIEVQIGATDGSQTEVLGDGVQEGMEVVIGEARNQQAGDAPSNPFTPKLFGGQKKAQQ